MIRTQETENKNEKSTGNNSDSRSSRQRPRSSHDGFGRRLSPSERHQDLRNDWKAFSIGSAIVGLAGLASGDQNVAIAGAVGSVYSAYRLSTDEPHRRDWDDHRWAQHEWVRVHERERERERARLAERERARFREFDREYRR